MTQIENKNAKSVLWELRQYPHLRPVADFVERLASKCADLEKQLAEADAVIAFDHDVLDETPASKDFLDHVHAAQERHASRQQAAKVKQ